MNMTYLHHSGFQIETKHSVLLFDYYTQNGMFDRVNEGDFPHKKFYIFVSHGHGDHYDPAILRWADRAHYILSDDVELPKDFKGEVTWVKPHQKLTVDDLEIETLASNDQGVAFVVKVAGKRTVFHAGDLNWWHWNGESEEFNNDIADSYRQEIDLLKGREINVACVPAALVCRTNMTGQLIISWKPLGQRCCCPCTSGNISTSAKNCVKSLTAPMWL